MKTFIAASVLALAIPAAAAFAQDDTYRATTTTVQPDTGGGYTVNTTRERVQTYDSSGRPLDTAGTTPSTTKRVERDYTDANGNQTKSVTDHTTDAYGNKTTTHYEENSTTTNP